MRKFRFCFLLALCTGILLSCKQSLDVNEQWKDITIVYGILDQSDTIHYIKITKAFLGPGDALQYAKIPDSSNYSARLEVRLDEYSNNTFIKSLILNDTLITNKDSGIFYFPVQKVYSTKEKLDQAYQYRLWIRNTETGKLIQANTILVNNFVLEKPAMLPGVDFVPQQATDVQWISPVGGKRYQLTFRIHYSEYHYGDSAKTFHYLDWLTFTKVRSLDSKGGETMLFTLPGIDFYKYLGDNLSPNPDIVRSLGRCDLIFLTGSDDLDSYLEVSQQSNSIIEFKPPFSDIANGIGLYASRHVQAFDTLQFTDRTKDSLKINRYTKDLGF